MHRLCFYVELRVECVGERCVECAFGEPEAARRLRSERRGQRHRLLLQLCKRHSVPDQAPRFRLCGRNLFGQKEHARGALHANQSGHKKRPARVGNEPKFREAFDKTRFVGGDRDVTGEREIGARTSGDPVHGADHWLFECADGANNRVVARLDEFADVGHGPIALRQRFCQVLARTKATSGTGEQDRSHGSVNRGVLQRRLYLKRHRACEAVEHIRSVERDGEDAILLDHGNEGVRHVAKYRIARVQAAGIALAFAPSRSHEAMPERSLDVVSLPFAGFVVHISATMPTKSSARSPRTATRAAASPLTPHSGFDWHRIVYTALVSRRMDDIEEATNRNRNAVPKDHVVLYQFSSRGHEVPQIILGSLITGRHDAAGAYYRSRPLMLSLGAPLADAFGSPLGRAGGWSDGRDIGVVYNLPTANGPVVLPVSGDVGSQYTPTAGWAQSIVYHRDTLVDASYAGSIAVVCGGDASVATNGFWSALTIATTLKLPMLFYIEDNDLGISVKGDLQTAGGNIAANLASFTSLRVTNGDGCNPHEASGLLFDAVAHVRANRGPALVRLTVPRLSSHSGPDNQKGYRSDAEIADDLTRDPLPKLREYLVPALMTDREWAAIEVDVDRDVNAALDAARARAMPDAAHVARFVYADANDDTPEAFGGLSRSERHALGGSHVASDDGDSLRFAEAVRRTLRHELTVNPKVLVFGEDVGRKGGVHLVTEGLQKQFGGDRVFDTSLSEEGIVGRAVGMAYAGLMPVAEIQFRKYADPAAEQLNNCGTVRWRTANRFAAPIVVRMPGGFGKDVGDPWHSLSDEVRFAHAYGWQVAMPSNASDAVGLLRSAMRGANPTIFFEHRSLLMTGDGSARYPGDEYMLPFGQLRRVSEGSDVTLVTWGAMVHRCAKAVAVFGGSVDLLDLRTIAPWDREGVLASVRKTGRCLVVHEDNMTAGFGAEVAAAVAQDAFWFLEAPVERLAPRDVPMPYHEVLLDAVLPGVEEIVARLEGIGGV